jgi:hypothetical protein
MTWWLPVRSVHHMMSSKFLFSSVVDFTWLVKGNWKYFCDCVGCCYVKKFFTLFMAMKQKCLYLNTKLEVICPCEVCGPSKSGIGRWYGLTSLTLFTILKNKNEVWSGVLCDGSPVPQKHMANTENRDLDSMIFKWFLPGKTGCHSRWWNECQGKKPTISQHA